MQIHVDRYKHSIYSHLTDLFLRSLTTLDHSKSRFHACERFNRCPNDSGDDVVYINLVTIGKSQVATALVSCVDREQVTCGAACHYLDWYPIPPSLLPRLHTGPNACGTAGPTFASRAAPGTSRVCLSIPPTTRCAEHFRSVYPWL